MCECEKRGGVRLLELLISEYSLFTCPIAFSGLCFNSKHTCEYIKMCVCVRERERAYLCINVYSNMFLFLDL